MILYLLFGVSYSFMMNQLNKFLNETNPYVDLTFYTWTELILMAIFWPFFLLIFIVSFFKS